MNNMSVLTDTCQASPAHSIHVCSKYFHNYALIMSDCYIWRNVLYIYILLILFFNLASPNYVAYLFNGNFLENFESRKRCQANILYIQ